MRNRPKRLPLGRKRFEIDFQKIKLEGGRPWGFKIAGGAEVNKPIIITKVINLYSYLF